MSYFRTDAEAMHLAASEDGLHWLAVAGGAPVLTGSVGTRTLRDPFVTRAPDGVFHLLATDGWSSQGIVHATSDDLLHWSEQTIVPVMANVAGTASCWAPESFFDVEAGAHRVIWSSAVAPPCGPGGHRIWCASTPDFVAWSPPEMFFDPGFDVIDATVVRADPGYLMAVKDERGQNRRGTSGKRIQVRSAPTAQGPWTDISGPVTPELTEGPTLFRRGTVLTMFFDHFAEGRYGALESTDGRAWEPVEGSPTIPPGARHATVLDVSDEVGRHLLALAVR